LQNQCDEMDVLLRDMDHAKRILAESAELSCTSQQVKVSDMVAQRLTHLATNPFKIDLLESFAIDVSFEPVPEMKYFCKITPKDIWHKEYVGAPSKPDAPVVERIGLKIFARWKRPQSEGGSIITKFVLRCVYSDTKNVLSEEELSANEFSRDVTMLCENSIVVQFQVQAVNTFGGSRFSDLSAALHSSTVIVCGRNENGRT